MGKNKKENTSGSHFYFDLKEILKFVLECDEDDIGETEIVDTYDLTSDSDDKNVSKVIRELKSRGNSQRENLKYDLVKSFIEYLMVDTSEEALGPRFNLALNTLMENNMIKRIDDGKE